MCKPALLAALVVWLFALPLLAGPPAPPTSGQPGAALARTLQSFRTMTPAPLPAAGYPGHGGWPAGYYGGAVQCIPTSRVLVQVTWYQPYPYPMLIPGYYVFYQGPYVCLPISPYVGVRDAFPPSGGWGYPVVVVPYPLPYPMPVAHPGWIPGYPLPR